MKPLKNGPFYSITALGSNFNPPPILGELILEILHVLLTALWNACPVNSAFNWADKIEHFSKVSLIHVF
jgi:O-antigen ligase